MPKDQREAIEKAKRFSHNAYVAECEKIERAAEIQKANTRAKLASQGLASSSVMLTEMAQIDAERIKVLVETRLTTTMEGYELYSVEVDDEMATSLCFDLNGEMDRLIKQSRAPQGSLEEYISYVARQIAFSSAAIRTQIDRRRLRAKPTQPDASAQGSKHKNHQPRASAPTLRENSRRDRLRELLSDLRTLRLCGPSDDPDEQSSVMESYRYLLINIRALCKGLMPSDVSTQLYAVPSKIESIYDVYESKAHLDAVCVDVWTELEFPTSSDSGAENTFLVPPSLIDELGKVTSASFDVTKLMGYCEEINSCFSHGNVVACLLLMRTVLNHVPPVFGHRNFAEVTANAGKSLKENLEHLEGGLRKLADLYAHQPIRKIEQYPTKSQVEPFRAQFELLLHEVLGKLK